MELSVYPEEKFERGALWYSIFGLIAIGIVLLSFFHDNWYGGIILLLLAGVYLYFHIRPKAPIVLKLTPQGLMIGNTTVAWINLQSYVIEFEKKTLRFKNIVFLIGKRHEIYTIADTAEHLQQFSDQLEQYIPRVGEYPQTGLEKFYRKIKL